MIYHMSVCSYCVGNDNLGVWLVSYQSSLSDIPLSVGPLCLGNDYLGV